MAVRRRAASAVRRRRISRSHASQEQTEDDAPSGPTIGRLGASRAPLRGPLIGVAVWAATHVATPAAVAAQERELKEYGAGSPEAKLMLYYSSGVAFSPLGMSQAIGTWGAGPDRRFEGALEISYLPPLSAEQRTVGTDKPEATNLAPVFARPRVAARLPGSTILELSWIPPFRVFDVKANLFAGAVAWSIATGSSTRVVPRISFLTGRVEGPITCNSETAAEGGPDLATYYGLVCYGNDSQDYFEPRHLSGEVIVTRTLGTARWYPYVSVGARSERTRFDVGVITSDGSRDQDQPILEVKTTRAYGTLGASWFGLPRTRLTGELYYAPGSVLTVRGLAGVALW